MSNENVITRKQTTITLRDDNEYVVVPLTLNELIKVWPIIQKLEDADSSMSSDLIQDMIEVAYIAFQGKIEKDKIGDLVDLGDLKTIITAIVGSAS